MSKNRLILQGTNSANASTIRATLMGDATAKIFWFDLTDLEKLDSEALGQSLERFLAEFVVADRTLKPRK